MPKDPLTRRATCRLLEMVEEGVLDRDALILACFKYMSEDEVADMAHINGFFENDEENEPEDDEEPDDEE